MTLRREPHDSSAGLRSFGAALLVGYLIGVPGFRGGRVGGDVLLFLSGFLATGGLVTYNQRLARRTATNWYARRILRVGPSTAIMVSVVSILSILLLAPHELRHGLFGWVLPSDRPQLNAAGNEVSPLWHLVYLRSFITLWAIWPLVLGPLSSGVANLLRGIGLRVTLASARTGLLAVAIALATWSLRGAVGGDTALFSLRAHFIPFAGGAVTVMWLRRPISRDLRAGVTLIGLSSVLIGAWFAGSPGQESIGWTICAAAGSAMVMVGSKRDTRVGPNPISRALASPIMETLGSLSDGWILWTYPIASFMYVLSDGQAAYTWGAAAVVLLLTVPGRQVVITRRRATGHAEFDTHIHRRRSHALARVVTGRPVREDPILRRLLAATVGTAAVAVTLSAAASVTGEQRLRRPAARAAQAAIEDTAVTNCSTEVTPEELIPPRCRGGVDTEGAPVLLLVGDTRAAQWMPAVSKAGEALGVNVWLRSLPGCPVAGGFGTVSPSDAALGPFAPSVAEEAQCQAFQSETLELISIAGVKWVLSVDRPANRAQFGTVENWEAAYGEFAVAVARADAHLVRLTGQPRSENPTLCEQRPIHMKSCRASRAEARSYHERFLAAEQRIAEDLDVPTFDTAPLICPTSPCPIRADGQWMYARDDQLTQRYAAGLSLPIAVWLKESLSGLPG